MSATTILTLAEPRPSSGSVTAIGVLAIISGGSTALGSLFLITSLLQPNSHFVLVSGWIIGALLLLLSAFGIAIGVGLLKRKNWSRISGIAWAIASISPGLNVFAPKLDLAGIFSNFAAVAVALWALVVLARTGRDAEFFEPGRESRLPAAVAAVGWLLALTILDIPVCLAFHLPFFILGHGLFGFSGSVAHVLTSLLAFFVGVALLRMKPFGIGLALGLQVLQICNGIVNDLSTTVQAQLDHVISDILAKFSMPPQSAAGPVGMQFLVSSVTHIVIAACLVGFWTKYREAVSVPLGPVESR